MGGEVSQNTLRQYQSKIAIREVLGCIVNNPTLLKTYKISLDDFVEAFHKVVLVGINNLINMGINKIDSISVEEYLKESFPTKYIIFKRNDGAKYIDKASQMATEENFEANYNELKKYSLLRDSLKQGFDVTDFFDPDETDPDEIDKKRELFEESSIEDMLDYFKRKILDVSSKYSVKNGRDSVKAGSIEAEMQKEKWKQTPEYGLSYASQYLNAVTRGIRKKRFVLGSAASGTGKTRISVANLCFSFVPKVYNSFTKQWEKNPHGTQNAGLYIGTEMELIEEVEPILWAYIADVPEEHILDGAYESGEEERVDEAIRILREESRIYLEYVPDYDVATLERIIDEHITRHHIDAVFFDYVHSTTDLISEYQSNAKAKMQVREDQVLANLGLKLKELTRKYNISIDTWTQVSGDIKNEQNRDVSVVRGAKALVDKCDTAMVVTRPTTKELKLLEPIIRKQISKHNIPTTPNLCYSVYKNRGGKLNNVKIWMYINYDTMRVHDLFMTDYEYQIKDAAKLYLGVNEDEKVVTGSDTEELKKKMIEAKVEINAIKDDGYSNALAELEDKPEDELTKKQKLENVKKEVGDFDVDYECVKTPEEPPKKINAEEYRDRYLKNSTKGTLEINKKNSNSDFPDDW